MNKPFKAFTNSVHEQPNTVQVSPRYTLNKYKIVFFEENEKPLREPAPATQDLYTPRAFTWFSLAFTWFSSNFQ